MEKGEEWNVNVVVWSSVHGGLEMMWLEFRDWKLLRCLTAVAPQLRHSLEIATLEPFIHSLIHSFYTDPSLVGTTALSCTLSDHLPICLYASTLRLRTKR
jgi:hypothetical protein